MSHLELLRPSIVRGRVIDDPSVLAGFGIPERGSPGKAAYAVEPGDHAELSSVAAWAYANRERLVIQGANSGLVGASTPDASGTQGVLRLNRLDRVIDLSPRDRAVMVEPGVTLDDLNRVLTAEGLFFPVEVGSNPSVGGLVSTNAGGARTIRYGDVSRNVLGVEAVLADRVGSTVGRATMLEKDNSRLNIGRLFVGSYGALGVISRISLRLSVRPTQIVVALLGLDTHHQVLPCLDVLERVAGRALSAFEMISGEAMRIATTNLPDLPRPLSSLDYGAFVLVELSDVGGSELTDLLAGAIDAMPSVDEAVFGPPSDFWRIRHSLTEGIRSSGATLRFDVAVPRAQLPELHDRVVAAFEGDPDAPAVSQFGHWGDGGTHLQVIYRDGVLPDDVSVARARVYDIVVNELGGTFSAEHGLGPHNADYYLRYVPAAERQLAGAIKNLLDPHGIWGRSPLAES